MHALWTASDWDRLSVEILRRARAMALRLVRGVPDAIDRAEDIAQDTLIRCWQCLRVPAHPVAYVLRVARHRALDVRKSGEFRRTVRKASLDAVDSSPSKLDRIIACESHVRTMRKVRALPPIYQTAVMNSVFGDPADAPVDAVNRMRLMRARRMIAASG